MSAIDAARDFGIDLSLIDESLGLTPEQRAIQHQNALDMARQMKAAFEAREGGNRDGRAQSSTTDPIRS